MLLAYAVPVGWPWTEPARNAGRPLGLMRSWGLGGGRMRAPVPVDETERLIELRELHLLDMPPDPHLLDVARVAAQQCATPMAGITVVDDEHWHCLAGIGVDVFRAPREVSMCAHTICRPDLLEVNNARADPRFADNPYVAAGVVRFYAGVPLVTDAGHALGALCVGDRVPRRLTGAQRDLLTVLARLVTAWLTAASTATTPPAVADPRLHELDAMKDEILTLVSHELRTPIASIQSSLELLAEIDTLTPQAAARILPPLRRNATRLLDTLDQLLLAARLSTSHLQIPATVVDLAELAAHAATRAAAAAARRNVRIVVRSVGPVAVLGDHALLGKAIAQMLANAIVHGPPDSEVSIETSADPLPTLAVTDAGQGLPAHEQHTVFRPFDKTEATRRQHAPGLGLGLTIAKAIINAHGGTITLDSQPTQGTTITATLPPPSRTPSAGPSTPNTFSIDYR